MVVFSGCCQFDSGCLLCFQQQSRALVSIGAFLRAAAAFWPSFSALLDWAAPSAVVEGPWWTSFMLASLHAEVETSSAFAVIQPEFTCWVYLISHTDSAHGPLHDADVSLRAKQQLCMRNLHVDDFSSSLRRTFQIVSLKGSCNTVQSSSSARWRLADS